jgi:SAM-dependent methyltransferase
MNELETQSKKWNQVYSQTSPEELPWFGLSFPEPVARYFSSLNEEERLLITGCGAGDVAYQLGSIGFQNVLGSDISPIAIERAKGRFPDFDFEAVATEHLDAHLPPASVNAFDWLNLHQVASVEGYLVALRAVSKALCVAWIRDSQDQDSGVSYVHGGSVHYHDPEKVRSVLEQGELSMVEQFAFNFESNPNAKVVRKHAGVGQIYRRRAGSPLSEARRP